MGLIACSTTQASSNVYRVVRLLQSTDYVTVTTTYHHYNIVNHRRIAIDRNSKAFSSLEGAKGQPRSLSDQESATPCA